MTNPADIADTGTRLPSLQRSYSASAKEAAYRAPSGASREVAHIHNDQWHPTLMEHALHRVEDELRGIEPHARRLGLGGRDCLHFQIAAPAFTFDNIVAPHQDGVVVLKARDSYRADLAEELLQFIQGKELAPDAILVHQGFRSRATRFDHVTVVPPRWANCFQHQSDYLQRRSYWVLPSYRCEFQSGLNGQEFELLIGNKGGRIAVADWNRAPTPQARIQLLTEWPGGSLRRTRTPGIVYWQAVVRTATELPDDVAIRILNIVGDELRVSRTHGAYQCTVTGPRAPETTCAVDRETLEALLTTFLRCDGSMGSD